MLSLLAMVLPSVAGWGPREGVTAWAFSAAGLGAEQGAATAVAYGVVLAASLPGSLVLIAERLPRRSVSSKSVPAGRGDGCVTALRPSDRMYPPARQGQASPSTLPNRNLYDVQNREPHIDRQQRP